MGRRDAVSSKHNSFIASDQYGFTGSKHYARNTVVVEPDDGGDPIQDGSTSGERSVFKLNQSGTVVWGYDAGTTAYGVSAVNGVAWAVGGTNSGWHGSPAAHADNNRTAWKLSRHGRLLSTAFAGSTLYDVHTAEDGSAFVVGDRSTNGTGSNASLWKITADGTVAWGYDTGGHLYHIYYHEGTGICYVAGIEVSNVSLWGIRDDGSSGTLITTVDMGQQLTGIGGSTVGDGTGVQLLVCCSSAQADWPGNDGSGTDLRNVFRFAMVSGGLDALDPFDLIITPDTQGQAGPSGEPTVVGEEAYIMFGAGDDSIVRINSSGEEVDEGRVGDAPEACASDGTNIWVASRSWDLWSDPVGSLGGNLASVYKMPVEGLIPSHEPGVGPSGFGMDAGYTWGWDGTPKTVYTTTRAYDVWTDGSGYVWVGNIRDDYYKRLSSGP